MSSERLDALEATIAYQEQTIEELREALAEHYRQIEALRRELANITAELRQVAAHPSLAEGPEPPPPHY